MNSYQKGIKVRKLLLEYGLGFYFVDCYLEVFLPMSDAFFAVFASSEVHRIELFAFNDGLFRSGLE